MCYTGDEIVRIQSEGIEATQGLTSPTETMRGIRITRAKVLISRGGIATAKDGDEAEKRGQKRPGCCHAPI